MEAAGVEPASASASGRAATCVDHWSSRRGQSVINRSVASHLCSRPPTRWHDQGTSPNYRRLQGSPRAGNPRDGLQLRKNLRQPSPCQYWQLKLFPNFYEDRDLGTLPNVHQTRRNRDAPDGSLVNSTQNTGCRSTGGRQTATRTPRTDAGSGTPPRAPRHPRGSSTGTVRSGVVARRGAPSCTIPGACGSR